MLFIHLCTLQPSPKTPWHLETVPFTSTTLQNFYSKDTIHSGPHPNFPSPTHALTVYQLISYKDSCYAPIYSTHYHTPPHKRQGGHQQKNWQDQTYHHTYSPNSWYPSIPNQEDTSHLIKRKKHKTPSASTTRQKYAFLQHFPQYLYLIISGCTT